jgi:hypothetical protein
LVLHVFFGHTPATSAPEKCNVELHLHISATLPFGGGPIKVVSSQNLHNTPSVVSSSGANAIIFAHNLQGTSNSPLGLNFGVTGSGIVSGVVDISPIFKVDNKIGVKGNSRETRESRKVQDGIL